MAAIVLSFFSLSVQWEKEKKKKLLKREKICLKVSFRAFFNIGSNVLLLKIFLGFFLITIRMK